MSDRSCKKPPQDAFPGMPDILPARPPKAADGDHKARTLDEAIERSHAILDEALADYPIERTYALFSGGNDSVNLIHLMRERYDEILHVNTGIGIPATTVHVHAVAAHLGKPLHELHPRVTYEDLVMGQVLATTGDNAGQRAVWVGFPGPAGHKVMYRRLKDEPLQRFRRSVVGDQGRRRKVAYLGGMRWAETARRFRNAQAIDQEGAIVWVSPLVHWTEQHMREYRDRHRCQRQHEHEHAEHRLCGPGSLPLNDVTAHLHMSGECLCGAYAKPGELDEVGFFYPEVAERIRELERRAEAAGLARCRWGVKKGGEPLSPRGGRLCASCVPALRPQLPGQQDLVDVWRDSGLLTEDQAEQLERGC